LSKLAAPLGSISQTIGSPTDLTLDPSGPIIGTGFFDDREYDWTSCDANGLCTFNSIFEDYANLDATSLVISTDVPEPSTWAMRLIGFAAIGFAGYRRSRRVNFMAQ
jgi:hypothetical protein